MRMWIGVIFYICLTANAFAGDFTLKSDGFSDKGVIPDSYTCEAGNNTPALKWTNPPAKTKSFVIIFRSLDTPLGKLYNWIVYNIPKDIKELKAGMKTLPDGALVAQNSFNQPIYRGPCPIDSKLHRYIIMIYALDTQLQVPEGGEPEEVLEEMEGHILGKAKLRGVFSH